MDQVRSMQADQATGLFQENCDDILRKDRIQRGQRFICEHKHRLLAQQPRQRNALVVSNQASSTAICSCRWPRAMREARFG